MCFPVWKILKFYHESNWKIFGVCYFILLGEENQTNTFESTSNGQFADEPSAKKAKVEVPLAQTFEVSEALRSGKNTLSK